MENINLNVGKRLKSIRQNKELSLDEVSNLTNVSKPALAQIERGASSPTINTLWKISNGLKVPLSYFLQEQENDFQIVDFKSHKPILEYGELMKTYAIFPYCPTRNMEIFYIEFAAGCDYRSQQHLDGVEEYLFVIQGKLQLVLNGREIVVKEKQSIRFRDDIPHQYNNPFNEMCAAYNIIFYLNA
ncbi:helix-turn-helix domain-containing protein [Enterocloster citroniae]|uniref:helix-turn-helix domain-containing protein n=1 Tax=Enterocloster citroniae TaxID=358743 RepID=UPI0018999AD6|nr:helix-turn-helix domain-containing protein [Enterocloster citroniae]